MHTKNSAGDNSSVSKTFGPIAKSANSDFSSNYFGNVVKEYSEWYNAPGNGKHTKEAGQFWGAVLKGSKYDPKGKQTNKGKK
jgi:hypothetical protein